MKQKLQLLLPIIILCFSLSAFGQINLTDDLLAHYKLDNNANDATDNGNDGTVIGATSVDDRFGNPNSAYQFDGVNDAIRISNAFDNKRPGEDEFTMSIWMKADDNKTGCLLSQTTSCSTYSEDYFVLALTYVHNYSDIYAQFYNHSPFVSFNDDLVFDDDWHQIIYTYSSGTAKLYLNGELKSMNVYNHNPQSFNYSSDVDWVIGGAHINNCSHNNNFSGWLDDVRIYGRALTEDEVKELHKLEFDEAEQPIVNNPIDDEVEELEITISPNPSPGQIKVKATFTGEKSFSIKVYNGIGQFIEERIVRDAEGVLEEQFDFSRLAQGMYLIKIDEFNDLNNVINSVTKKVIIKPRA